ncbi:uncharacterized protein LOC134654897 [Cydia amplana]|uniref:uncharacterized protein LOC134654897 n=1 Tax=Cydia amplana TaxID=1869771 RepID=UPI002FE604B3
MNIGLKPIDIFILTENIFGLYKNISTCSKLRKTIAITIISIELSLCLYVIYTIEYNNFNNVLLTFFFQLNSIVSILMSCYYSKACMKFINCLNFNDILVDFLHDKIYFKRMASHFKFGLKRICGYIFLYIVTIIISEIYDVHIVVRTGEQKVVLFGRALSVLRLHVEYNFICFTFHTISEQLQCITRSVVGRNLYHCEDGDVTQTISIEKWRQNYINVKKCTVFLNEIIGIQLASSFCIIAMRYINTCYYSVVVYGLKGYLNIGMLLFYGGMCISMWIIYATVQAAQSVQNSVSALTRCLKLLFVLEQANEHTDENKLKIVKQLLKIVTTRPISVKAFGGIDVNMTLIPSCLNIVAVYTIIALQFNNIV